MNKTEAAYAEQLEARKINGEIEYYAYEAVTLKLTETTVDGRPGTRYTPDFLVMLSNGTLECHEVKGHWAEKDLNRLKVAADKFPFRFIAIRKVRGAFEVEEF